MRVLLINPPYRRFMRISEDMFPLGLGYIGTMLSEKNHFVRIYNADFDRDIEPFSYSYEYSFSHQHNIVEALNNDGHYIWKEVREKIELFSPDIVGITVMTNKYAVSLKIAKIIKKINKGIKVIVGGHHPTLFHDEFLINKNIDFVVRGEGEETFLELIKELESNKNQFTEVDGLSFRQHNNIIHNRNRKLILNLDSLPYPNRELLLDKEDYFPKLNFEIITARGCPFSCAYCGAFNMWGRKIRFRSVQNIIGEMLILCRKYNIDQFLFWDDSFTMDKKRIVEFCNKLRNISDYCLKWSCITRLDLIDEELLQQMRESGCRNIYLGVESGSEEMLKLIKKGITKEKIREKSVLMKSSGIKYSTFFMMGLPGETKEQILETYNFMKEIGPDNAEINIFNPLPGTKLCKSLQDAMVLSQDVKWENFSQESMENYYTKGMTKEEFSNLILEMAKRFDEYNHSQAYRREIKEGHQRLAESYAILGNSYLKYNQLKKAICKLEKAIELDCTCILGQYHLGSCYQKIGDLEKAIGCFKKVLQINTINKKRFWAGAHFYLSEVYYALNEIVKAKLELEECLKLNPVHRKAKENLVKYEN
ncbi:MAG: radical SAM protein [bacterium]|nr:radical SAM protein [bacterium]